MTSPAQPPPASVSASGQATVSGSRLGKAIVALSDRVLQWRGGFRKRAATVRGATTRYYVGGRGPAVVLLHPMASDKASFLASARRLTSSYRVILPDLDGHGENGREPSNDYSIRGQAEWMHDFIAALGLDRVHLGGNSMGGHVALAFTIRFPKRVASLMLCNAPGLEVGGVDRHTVYTGFGGPMATMEDLGALLERVYHQPPTLPGPVARHLIAEFNRGFEHLGVMLEHVKEGEDIRLNERLAEVDIPTLILWGVHDKVTPVSVGQAYLEHIRDARLVLLDDASHGPQMEVPTSVGEELERFLGELTAAPDN